MDAWERGVTAVQIGDRSVGEGQPVYVVAELGQNHNGNLDTAIKLLRAASVAQASAAKLQKRDPSMICIPEDQRTQMRETPWGLLDYVSYRQRLELGRDAYDALFEEAHRLGIDLTASVWDEPSVDFMEMYEPPFYKIPSACLTDDGLLRRVLATGRPIIMSVGMSSVEQIDHAIGILQTPDVVLLWCRSSYPCDPRDLNLAAIPTLRGRYGCVVGYSGHEIGLWTTLCAVVMGASVVERHLTLSRASWGSDHAASVEPHGFAKLIEQIRRWESARGSGSLGPTDRERESAVRLRRYLK